VATRLQRRQNPPLIFAIVVPRLAAARRISDPGQAVADKSATPLAGRCRAGRQPGRCRLVAQPVGHRQMIRAPHAERCSASPQTAGKTEQRLAFRAQIILALGKGLSNKGVAAGNARGKWRGRSAPASPRHSQVRNQIEAFISAYNQDAHPFE
jgi:hypothetical protein